MPTYILNHGPAEYVNEAGSKRATRIEVAFCVWDGRRFEARSSKSAIMKLARMLVGAGAPDAEWRSFTAAGTPSMSGPSIHRLAKLTVSEPAAGSIKIVPYVERSDFSRGPTQEPGDGTEGSEDTGEEPGRHPATDVSAGTGRLASPAVPPAPGGGVTSPAMPLAP